MDKLYISLYIYKSLDVKVIKQQDPPQVGATLKFLNKKYDCQVKVQ